MVKFKDFSRPLSVFQVLFKAFECFSSTLKGFRVFFKYYDGPLSVFQGLFKANLLFKDYPVYSSTFQACEKPVQTHLKAEWSSLLLE